MTDDITDLLNQTKRLFNDKDELFEKLHEAIRSIKNGNADAVFLTDNKAAKILTLSDADQTYRNFVESMSEGVVIIQSDGIILFSNLSFAKMVNLPIEKVIGSNLHHFIPDEFAERFEKVFDSFPDIYSKVEWFILPHTGVEAHYMVSMNKLTLHNHIAISLMWTDVTSQKKIESELITVNKDLTNVIEDLKRAIDDLKRAEKK